MLAHAHATHGLQATAQSDKFDVLHYRDGQKFVARLIYFGWAQNDPSGPVAGITRMWQYILQGTSEINVVSALEDLYTKLGETVPKEVKSTCG